jgi:hypothetical protein
MATIEDEIPTIEGSPESYTAEEGADNGDDGLSDYLS